MEQYTLYSLLIVVVVTMLLSISLLNLLLINKSKKSDLYALRLKEQSNVIALVYSIVFLLSLYLNAVDSFSNITLSFLFLIWPNIYFVFLESYEDNFSLSKYYNILYGSYLLAIVALIFFFVFDFYEQFKYPIEFFVWSLLLPMILYFAYLFIQGELYRRCRSYLIYIALIGLLFATIVLFSSSVIHYLNYLKNLSHILLVIFLICIAIINTNDLIDKLKNYYREQVVDVDAYSSMDEIETKEIVNTIAHKYVKSSIDKGKQNDIAFALEQLPKEYFYNPYLTLNTLADTLNTSSYEVSHLFSNHLNTNFNQYINAIRALKAKELLADERYADMSVKNIGIEVGFSSSSSFYRVFKERYNIPPSEYRRNKE
ncbi:helix-turn-helix transcriptional regulator [Myroides sp. M-43]|uniref:helix-turn-helix transcriptional regulator n=1 Tax=Myroides oncorhynchi TaxID=2893756 RepID=UPI001E487BC8|nr:response regulator transcription factor [Myroides oncorhynchi]MCC9044406.1 helix-turn-helix transcriptional regulator [Myroides oncorhynchi]